MKILAAMDSFKGTLSSREAGNAVREGILSVCPGAEVTVRELADGGEGTVKALYRDSSVWVRRTVQDPLGRPVEASWLVNNGTAVMECASAIGLYLLSDEERNPERASTYGLGEMIRYAVEDGIRSFVIGIGGSATNDCGAGMLRALGWRFLDEEGKETEPCCTGLQRTIAVDASQVLPALKECTFRIACDVNNPLYGERGAAAVFGPQKGADPAMVERMDRTLKRFAELMCRYDPGCSPDDPGSGAAGGLGFAFRTFLHAELVPGAQLIMQESGMEDEIREADLIITGEGRMDAQTGMGKAPASLALLARKYGRPVIAINGSMAPGAGSDLFAMCLSTVDEHTPQEEIMDPVCAYRRLASTTAGMMLAFSEQNSRGSI